MLSISSKNKIIYLISPPRSLSVAFLRMMEARGDFHIMHEPSVWAYNIHHNPWARSWFLDNAPSTFSEVKKSIFDHACNEPVFVKEISFSVKNFIPSDMEFMQDPDIYFVFLMRKPHPTIVSFYRKIKDIKPSFYDCLSYKDFYDLIQATNTHAAHRPLVLLTEDLYQNPEQTVKQFCDHVDIPFKPEALTWADLGEEFTGHEKWHEIKYKEITQIWHSDAIRSTGFGKPTQYDIDENGNPTFIEITNDEHRIACKRAYQENMDFYAQIVQQFVLIKKID